MSKYEVFEMVHAPGSQASGSGNAPGWLLVRLRDGVLAKKAEGRLGDMIDLARELNEET